MTRTQMIVELVGYCGSLLVLVSFLMSSVVKLRVINSVGSVIFAVYALIIHSYPTALMNFCLVAINLRSLWRLRQTRKTYDLISVDKGDGFLSYVLKRYQDDIAACFPGLKLDMDRVNRAYIVCCDSNVAGVMAGNADSGTLEIALDYSTPAYRDCSIGKFLMERLPQEGIHKLLYNGPTQHHQAYLDRLGYEKRTEGYVRDL